MSKNCILKNKFSKSDFPKAEETLKDSDLVQNLCLERAKKAGPEQYSQARLLVPPSDSDLEKELAMMFLDIRNFTAFMESRSAHEVVSVIRKLFVLFGESVKKNGGRIIEVSGDSLYAVFGLKSSVTDAVKASYQTAVDIFADLEIFNSRYAMPYFDHNFDIGIGLHSGMTVVGQFDLDFKEHMTVMGLPVNLASRLQNETKVQNNNLLISEEAYQMLELEDEDHEQRTVFLKGISEAQQVRLLGKPYTEIRTGRSVLGGDFDYMLAFSG